MALGPTQPLTAMSTSGRLREKCDGTRAETRFRLSAKRTSPFKSAGASVQSITGSRGVRISGSNAGYTMFRGSVKSTGYTQSIRQFTLHFPFRASPCAITFQLDSYLLAWWWWDVGVGGREGPCVGLMTLTTLMCRLSGNCGSLLSRPVMGQLYLSH
jgi:hypothetical protein